MEGQPAYWEARTPVLFHDRVWYLNALADAGLSILDRAAGEWDYRAGWRAVKLVAQATSLAKDEGVLTSLRWRLPWALFAATIGTLRGDRWLSGDRLTIVMEAAGDVIGELGTLGRSADAQHLSAARSQALMWWLAEKRSTEASRALPFWSAARRPRQVYLWAHFTNEDYLVRADRVEATADLLLYPFVDLQADQRHLPKWFDTIVGVGIGPEPWQHPSIGRFWFDAIYRASLKVRGEPHLDNGEFLRGVAEPLGIGGGTLEQLFPSRDDAPSEEDTDQRDVDS